jgi:hypothetical protein
MICALIVSVLMKNAANSWQTGRLAANVTRMVYAVDAQGPGAAEIGPAIAADFPEVLAALSALAEVQS